MKPYEILTLVGGISSTSVNKRLYGEVVRLNQSNLKFSSFDISSLPFFSQDIENDYPASVAALKAQVRAADAILVITPEYNRSCPGVLKNALDWGSRPPKDNCWTHKPAAIMGASGGATGTLASQQHVRNVCSAVNMHLMSLPEFYFNASTGFDENGVVERSVDFVRSFLVSFERWIGNFHCP